jgi:hypothetical protein
MEKSPTREVPGEQVRPAGELVVLIRLVDRDAESVGSQSRCAQLAHRGMDRVFRPGRVRPLARVDQVQPRLETERNGDGGVCLDASGAAVLDRVNHRSGQAGAAGELTERPSPALTSLSNRHPDMAGQQQSEPIGPRA